MSDQRQPPAKIYIQWFDEDGVAPPIGHDVTWCEDRIESADTEYVPAIELERLRTQVSTLQARVDAADKLADSLQGSALPGRILTALAAYDALKTEAK
jgi:hypothetical protein